MSDSLSSVKLFRSPTCKGVSRCGRCWVRLCRHSGVEAWAQRQACLEGVRFSCHLHLSSVLKATAVLFCDNKCKLRWKYFDLRMKYKISLTCLLGTPILHSFISLCNMLWVAGYYFKRLTGPWLELTHEQKCLVEILRVEDLAWDTIFPEWSLKGKVLSRPG